LEESCCGLGNKCGGGRSGVSLSGLGASRGGGYGGRREVSRSGIHGGVSGRPSGGCSGVSRSGVSDTHGGGYGRCGEDSRDGIRGGVSGGRGGNFCGGVGDSRSSGWLGRGEDSHGGVATYAAADAAAIPTGASAIHAGAVVGDSSMTWEADSMVGDGGDVDDDACSTDSFSGFSDPGGQFAITNKSVHYHHRSGSHLLSDVYSCHGRVDWGCIDKNN